MPRYELTALSVGLPVLGTGSKLPGRAIDNAELLDSVANFITPQDARLGMRIGAKLGVRSRHVSRSFTEPSCGPRPQQDAPHLARRRLDGGPAR